MRFCNPGKNFQKSYVSLLLLVLTGCSLVVPENHACRILDPDLAMGIFRGSCKDGLADGYGEVDASGKSGGSYRGNFLAGKKHGKGIKIMPNGDRYEGDFRDDYRDGHGVYVWGEKTKWAGDRYEGGYRLDKRQGWGVYSWSGGDRYEGEWDNDMRKGPSVMEQRRAQAATAVEKAARGLKPGTIVCADQRWGGDQFQMIRGTVENLSDGRIRVRVTDIEGGRADYKGLELSVGSHLEDTVDHWLACGQY